MNLKAIIVEDEELPRLSLKQKIEMYHPDINIVGEFEDSENALDAILQCKPDVLFLDIQLLGDKTSLWLVERLSEISSMKVPEIIFTTAYIHSEYLMKAIKLGAADYLVKPIDIADLSIAIKKIKQRLSDAQEIESKPILLKLKTLFSILYIEEKDILYIEADGNYCKLIKYNGDEEPIFERLGDIEKKLPINTTIIRVGRKYLINKDRVYKLSSKDSTCTFMTGNCQSLSIELSKSGFDEIQDI